MDNPNEMEDEEQCLYTCYDDFMNAIDQKDENQMKSIMAIKGMLEYKSEENNDTLLHIVAQHGTLEIAKQLCNLGANVNTKNYGGKTPIYGAIRHSDDMVKLLLENGAKVTKSKSILENECDVTEECDATEECDVLPLHEALLSGSLKIILMIVNKALLEIDPNYEEKLENEEIVKVLLSHKEELGLVAKDHPLLILYAAKIGKKEVLQMVLDDLDPSSLMSDVSNLDTKGEKLESNSRVSMNIQGYFRRTALHYAVRERLPEVIRFLLEEKADVNCKTKAGFTPLHYAAALKNEEICKILLSFGAQVDPNSSGVINPLYILCGRNVAIYHLINGEGYFFDDYVSSFMLIQPTRKWHVSLTKLLLTSGANPDIKADNGLTPLLEACNDCNFELANTLLQHGANVEITDNSGNSALHYAALGNAFAIVDLLLKKGLDINIRNDGKYTPLLYGIERGQIFTEEMIEYLVDCGADVNARNANGATALHVACYLKYPDFVECLLELGADATLKYNPDSIPIVGEVPRKVRYFSSLVTCPEVLTSHIALRQNGFETNLEDYINFYFQLQEDLSKALEYFQKSRIEVEKLMSRKFVEDASDTFYDFLIKDSSDAVQILRNDEIRKVLRSRDYYQEFPCYKFLLEKRFERVEALENVVEKAEDTLNRQEEELEAGRIYSAKIFEIREYGVEVRLNSNVSPIFLYNKQLDARSVSCVRDLSLQVGQEFPVFYFGRHPKSSQIILTTKM